MRLYSLECTGLQRETKADGLCYEMSCAFATTDLSDDKFSMVSFMSAESGLDRGSQSSLSENEASLDYKSKFSYMESFPHNISSSSELEDGLKMELELIEQWYQETITDLSKKRHHAILNIRRKSKNMVS